MHLNVEQMQIAVLRRALEEKQKDWGKVKGRADRLTKNYEALLPSERTGKGTPRLPLDTISYILLIYYFSSKRKVGNILDQPANFDCPGRRLLHALISSLFENHLDDMRHPGRFYWTVI